MEVNKIRNKWLFTKIGIMCLLVSYLISGVYTSIIINQQIEELSPKLVVFGEVKDINYWNITIEDVNYNLFTTFGDKRNITLHFYNLTIFNYLIFSNVIYGFTCDIIRIYDIQINSIIIIHEQNPFIEITIYNR